VLAIVVVEFLKIQKNPSHPIDPTTIRYKSEKIDDIENSKKLSSLNSPIIILIKSNIIPPINKNIPVEIKILSGKLALLEYREPIAQIIAAISKIDIPKKLLLESLF
jgi:hypothetical protein